MDNNFDQFLFDFFGGVMKREVEGMRKHFDRVWPSGDFRH